MKINEKLHGQLPRVEEPEPFTDADSGRSEVDDQVKGHRHAGSQAACGSQ